MDTELVTEEEFRIIREVRKDKSLTQRKISQKTGISLGMVNLILKRLTEKGSIKVRRLNRRNLQYLLTPKGFTETTKRSYHYLLRTIDSVKKIKAEVQELVLQEYHKGKTEFIIFGDGELADIIELSLKNLDKSNLKYRRASRVQEISSNNAVILLAQTEPKLTTLEPELRTPKYIDVLATISHEL